MVSEAGLACYAAAPTGLATVTKDRHVGESRASQARIA